MTLLLLLLVALVFLLRGHTHGGKDRPLPLCTGLLPLPPGQVGDGRVACVRVFQRWWLCLCFDTTPARTGPG